MSNDGRLRVCIADDHLLMLHGVRDALLKAGDIDVVGLARSGAEVARVAPGAGLTVSSLSTSSATARSRSGGR